MGNHVERIYDVGVAGLHRLLRRLELIQRPTSSSPWQAWKARCRVWWLVVSPAGDSGADQRRLRASFGGLAALLGMLNSCGRRRDGSEH